MDYIMGILFFLFLLYLIVGFNKRSFEKQKDNEEKNRKDNEH
jgi:preprotein translocase subunit SecG